MHRKIIFLSYKSKKEKALTKSKNYLIWTHLYLLFLTSDFHWYDSSSESTGFKKRHNEQCAIPRTTKITLIAKARPGFDDWPEYPSVQINSSSPWLYQSIDIGAGIRVVDVDRPNILVPLFFWTESGLRVNLKLLHQCYRLISRQLRQL